MLYIVTGFPHSKKNSLSMQAPSAKLPDSMPCMTYDSPVKIQPWEFGRSPL
jgi:hypothetical protein